MSKNQQPTAEQLAAMAAAKNQQFMALTYGQPIVAHAQNGNQYVPGSTLNFEAPTVAGAYATRLVLRHEIKVNVTKGSGEAKLNAGAPYNFVNNISVNFGNKQITAHPFLAKVFDEMEGYARTTQDAVTGIRKNSIDSLLRQTPTELSEGENIFKFDTTIDLNQLHPASVNGIIPIYGTGTKLSIALNLANSITGSDPLDHVIKTTGDAKVEVSGNVSVHLEFRDHNSMTTREPLSPVLDNIPTVQIVQIPSVTPLTAGTFQHASVKNPYPFAKIISFVIDGNQSDKFASADNITGYTIDKAENSNSSFLRYDETTGGIENYYKEIRSRFGTDLDEGLLVFDATTQNIANVSSKMGQAFLNFTEDGYPAGRLGFKVNKVSTENGITPRVVTFGVILNNRGIVQG